MRAGPSTIEAVTKDNLTIGANGQIRYRVDENNLYAYLFGVVSPLEHVMATSCRCYASVSPTS